MPARLKATMLIFPASQWLRLALLALPVLLVLAAASPAAATHSYQLQSTGSSQEVTSAGTPESGANTAAAMPADSDTAGVASDAGGKDLTVFFVIGMAVNIIMITAFLFWAVGQWRKSQKIEG